MMDGATKAALGDLALLKPVSSLQNVGEKKKDDNSRDGVSFQAFGADGFTFLDFLDIVNPLQHIPVVSSFYREMTGDQIDPGSRIAGGALFGGPIGGLVATADVALTESTGKGVGDYIVSFLSGGDTSGGTAVASAQNRQEPDPAATASPEAGAGPGGFAPFSPIAANLEVLQWARRETALMAETHAGQAPDIPPPAELLSQAAENRTTAERAAAAQTKPSEIAANPEVLDWARTETLLASNPGLVHGGRPPDKVSEQEQRDVLESARQKAVASGLTQEQLTGATAPAGGWFSETMLLALASYQDSAGLGKPGTPANAATGQIGALDLNMDE